MHLSKKPTKKSQTLKEPKKPQQPFNNSLNKSQTFLGYLNMNCYQDHFEDTFYPARDLW